MMKFKLSLLALLLGGWAALAGMALPVPVHGGQLLAVRKTDTVSMRNTDKWLLKATDLKPADPGSTEYVEEVHPAAGNIFVVVELKMGGRFSVSKWDYQVRVAGKEYKCLAVSRPENPFDSMLSKVGPAGNILLLFELPLSSRGPELVFGFDAIRPQKPIPLPVPDMEADAGPPPVPAAPAPEGAPGAPATPAAPEAVPAAPAAPAPPAPDIPPPPAP